MSKPALPDKLSFVDIETTGGRLLYDRIIEVGVIRAELDKATSVYQVVDQFESLINPQQHIPAEITALTGINSAILENAPEFSEIKNRLLEMIEDSVMVAHNVRFDYSFLKQEYRRHEINFAPKHFCSVKLSRKLFPNERSHNLDAIINRFGFRCPNRHRALDDARVIWDFFQLALNSFAVDKVVEAVSLAMKRPTLPIKLGPDVLDNLPECPGVYIFYGQNGMPLYIGKSVNIRDRVLSHFSSDHHSGTELKISQQIESIETITTCGELGALLKEATLVKKLQPLYNRQLRNSQKLIIVRSQLDKEGYQSASLETLTDFSLTEIDNVIGVFRSASRAKDFLNYVNKEYQLCEKKLGLERSKGGCFGYRLGNCHGACVGKEPPVKYNFRFINAFAQSRIHAWPFSGPIMVEEQSQDGSLTERFIIDNWCLANEPEDVSDGLYLHDGDQAVFDLDAYKIIHSFLKSPTNLKKVTVLNTG